MTTPDRVLPVLIVGGGPIGLETAAALRAVGVEAPILEAGPVGATIEWWAPETQFFSSPERIEIAGAPLTSVDQSKATRERYLAYLRGVARQHGLDLRLFTRVVDARRCDGFVELRTVSSLHGVGGPAEAARSRVGEQAHLQGEGALWRAEKVVLAIGDMHRPRWLGVPGEDLPHVSHYFEDPHRCYGRRVLVVGGKNSAVEAALRLYRVGAEVAISYRGAAFDPKRVKYWLRPELEWLISQGRIEFHPCTTVRAIGPGWVELGPTGEAGAEARRLEADRVFLLTGYEQDPSLFEALGVSLVGEEQAPQHDAASMETNVPGVFVAGTAAAGSQRRTKVFIENSHVHVERIVRRIAGSAPPWLQRSDAAYAGLEES